MLEPENVWLCSSLRFYINLQSWLILISVPVVPFKFNLFSIVKGSVIVDWLEFNRLCFG